ncbi:Protein LUTEIN DEFICIENT 5 [Escovopsis weberi]|uniref:Protein LUTEIN DEFICIENT 5 n=1 Tax=Escovopsis weberi TaxID=150374 RepID=A0A0M9VRM1_ESCWE|nr:Protein LUTEIN DEFICIENT 5 [Escovopsis weberi]
MPLPLSRTLPNDGLLRYFWFLNSERIVLTSHKALAEVLVHNSYAFRKPNSVTEALGRVVGFGVLLAEGDDHKRQRRNLNPAFAFRHIKDLYPLFWDKSCELVAAMTAECAGPGRVGVLEIGEWSSRATLDIIGVAALGRDFRAIQDKDNELARAYDTLFKPDAVGRVLAVLGTMIPQSLIFALPLQRNREVASATRWVRELCRDLVREKKQRLATKDHERDVDILSVALESGQFSDDNLVDQLMTFLAAGHETTTRAVTWAIYLLCLHPAVQERLRAEVRANLPSTSALASEPANEGRSSRAVTSVDIDRLPYLAAVCSETLRCYTPIPVTVREAAHDTTIQGVSIPKGTRVMLVPHAINTDTAGWGERAEQFDPERWLARDDAGAEERQRAASGGAASNYAFLTFLHGPRSCIGSGFARAEMACLVAALVGRFSFELVDKELMDESKMEIRMEVTARPARGLTVQLRVLDDY